MFAIIRNVGDAKYSPSRCRVIGIRTGEAGCVGTGMTTGPRKWVWWSNETTSVSLDRNNEVRGREKT